MSEETMKFMNNQAIKIEPPEYSEEDTKREIEDEFDDLDANVRSESCTDNDETCLERFMNSEVTIEEAVKQESIETLAFECYIFYRSFAESHYLKEHMVHHMPSNRKENPFKCKLCHKTFTRVDHLKCNTCNKKFALLDNINCHILIHTEERSINAVYAIKHSYN
ncbi:zinc finger protein 366-like [Ctenocephalides felis]|uniref:zinc finger protein 366-like n=1 Tax=Ctenocephalides felis TaxID=7515 RepID=UPI000E6E46AF|nr:zinc finger protein 366-like [Ctenocephalides felis]